ncbi:cold-shock protein [Ferrimonas marina]|uniref:Cold shock protein, CspA family n=1 Tax=Ferrimonas marina TaxID=299255 RepID=A0A1M5T9G6_9GAMM|nr:cold shock domain-containing protein [Ferrimonas marina]SHH47260.1 Cold shock protein, CspA family [Ferrimonas marina]
MSQVERPPVKHVKGTVRQYVAEKGGGFIIPDIAAVETYVTSDDITGHTNLKPGDKVDFTMELTEKGLRARDVVLVHRRGPNPLHR